MPKGAEKTELSLEHREAIQRALKRLKDDEGVGEQEIAKEVGVSQQAINNARNNGRAGGSLLYGLLRFLGMTETQFMQTFYERTWRDEEAGATAVATVLASIDLSELSLVQRSKVASKAREAYAADGKITTEEVRKIVRAIRKSGVTVVRDE